MIIRKTYMRKTAAAILQHAHVERMKAGTYEIVTRSGLIVRGWIDWPDVIGLQDSYGHYVTYLKLNNLARERYCALVAGRDCKQGAEVY